MFAQRIWLVSALTAAVGLASGCSQTATDKNGPTKATEAGNPEPDKKKDKPGCGAAGYDPQTPDGQRFDQTFEVTVTFAEPVKNLDRFFLTAEVGGSLKVPISDPACGAPVTETWPQLFDFVPAPDKTTDDQGKVQYAIEQGSFVAGVKVIKVTAPFSASIGFYDNIVAPKLSIGLTHDEPSAVPGEFNRYVDFSGAQAITAPAGEKVSVEVLIENSAPVVNEKADD